MFEASLDELHHDKTGAIQFDKASGTEIKFVLEENGLDPVEAADDTNAVAGDDEFIAIPKGENLDPEFEDLEEALREEEEVVEEANEHEEEEELEYKVEHAPVERFPDELEHELKELPYTKYELTRVLPPVFNLWTFSWDRTPRVRSAGFFKGRILFIEESSKGVGAASIKAREKDEMDRMRNTFIPTSIVVRVYVYRGYYLIPVGSSQTNPILKLREGRVGLDRAQNYPAEGIKTYPNISNTLTPSWRHTFQDITMQIPGPSMLYLYVFDRQPGLFWGWNEAMIGYTKIDVEDRFYCRSEKHREWMKIQKPQAKEAVYRESVMPTEERTLYSDTSRGPQGKVEMFLQIHIQKLRKKVCWPIHGGPEGSGNTACCTFHCGRGGGGWGAAECATMGGAGVPVDPAIL